MIQSAHTSGARQGTQELLFDYLRRLETRRNGRRAVHVALSSLHPSRRRPYRIQAATAGFTPLVEARRGQRFTLENSDFLFVYKSGAQAQVSSEVDRLKKLLGIKPASKGERTEQKLDTWFDLETSFGAFVTQIRGAMEIGDLRSSGEPGPVPNVRGSEPVNEDGNVSATRETAIRLSQALQNADLSNLLRRQAVYALGRQMYPRPLFREFYYSIPDLGEAVLPRGNLTSNSALFRCTTRVLDKAMLSSLTRNQVEHSDRGISINLNLSTVLSDDFSRFDSSLDETGRRSTVIELQCADAVSESNAYERARAFLRERGYRICVDGVTAPALGQIDRVCSGVDFVKIHWDPELMDLAGKQGAEILTAAPKSEGHPRLVITRVGTPDAVAFGQSLGIGLFQGRYVDAFAKRDRRWRDLVRLNRGFQAGG